MSRACETARALVSRSLDEALDVVPRDVLALHVATCAACARFAADTEAVTRLLRDAPLEPHRVELRRPLHRAASRRSHHAAAAVAAAFAVGVASLAGGSTGPVRQVASPTRAVLSPVKLPIGQRMAEADFAAGRRPESDA